MKIPYQGAMAKTPAPAAPQASLFDAVAAETIAQAVTIAPTTAVAWDILQLPGGYDADLARDVLALVTPLSAASEAITRGLEHFAALAPDDEVPAEWVERMVELHTQELEGYWDLDEYIVASQQGGEWIARVAEPDLPLDPIDRIATRARWQAEALKPPTGKLALDKLRHRLDEVTLGREEVNGAGRALVAWVARWRFENWQTTRPPRDPGVSGETT